MLKCPKLFLRTPAKIVAPLGVFLMAGGIASSDPNLNCDAYAQAAVDQQAQNMQLKCGFQGRAWQLNYANHKTWCQTAGVTINHVSVEDQNRMNALQSCKAKKLVFIPLALKDCGKYAQTAISQQALNLAAKCGLSGKGWSTNHNAHNSWCAEQGVTIAMVNQETSRRANALKSCFSK